MRRAGVTGEVTVGFVVDASGNVRDVRVIKSTRPGFEDAARDAVRQWRFKPGRKAGRNVSAVMTAPVKFTAVKE